MVLVQIDLSEDENEIVEIVKIKNQLEHKTISIKDIIYDYGIIKGILNGKKERLKKWT